MENQDARTGLLKRIDLFKDLDQNALEYLAESMVLQTIPKYQCIYRPGEFSSCIYLLAKGVVKIGTHHDEGREMIKRILHPEMIFGELSVISEVPQADYAMSMHEDTAFYEIPVREFRSLMRRNHALSIRVMKMLGKRLQNTEARLESLVFKDARARIIDFLKTNAERRGRKIGYETLVKHCLTQQDIANLTGTSRQTVTSVLNDLRKSNLIYFNRRSILIRDLARLA